MNCSATILDILQENKGSAAQYDILQLMDTKFWSRLQRIFRCLVHLMAIFCHYHLGTLIYTLIYDPNYHHAGLHVYFVGNIHILYLFYWLLIRRRSLKICLRTLLTDASQNNPGKLTIRLKNLRKTLVCWGFFMAGNLLITLCVYYKNNTNFEYVYQSAMCFGCEFLQKKHFMATMSVTIFLIFSNMLFYGIPILFIAFFNLTVFLVSDSFDSVAELGEEFKNTEHAPSVITKCDNLLVLFQKTSNRIERCRKLVKDMDGIFQYSLLFWFAITILVTCIGTTWIVDEMDEINPVGLATFIPLYGMSITLIYSAVINGSMIGEKVQDLILQLNSLSSSVLLKNRCDHLLFLRAQLESPVITAYIGGCVPIKRRVLLTFLALATTYVVVFLQFNPSALTKIQDKLQFSGQLQ